MFRVALHLIIIVLLTLVTQIGGIAWILALFLRQRLVAFIAIYVGLSFGSVWSAPQFGRVAISCFEDGPLQVQSWMYCALNRTYVTPELADVLEDTATEMDRRYPGTVTLLLDGNFPFFDSFPLLPHLSHDDGEKADLAFYYTDGETYLPGATRSPIGYFAFEDGPTDCTAEWPTLRWGFAMLQPLWPDYTLDPDRNRAVLSILTEDTRVGRVFVEPHLVQRWSAAHPNIRFQGCRAARHDDHIHLQLR